MLGISLWSVSFQRPKDGNDFACRQLANRLVDLCACLQACDLQLIRNTSPRGASKRGIARARVEQQRGYFWLPLWHEGLKCEKMNRKVVRVELLLRTCGKRPPASKGKGIKTLEERTGNQGKRCFGEECFLS